MLSASLASLLLGVLMIVIVMVSHHIKINPDNVATPIAASLGDLITLSLLSSIAHGLYQIKGNSILCIELLLNYKCHIHKEESIWLLVACMYLFLHTVAINYML